MIEMTRYSEEQAVFFDNVLDAVRSIPIDEIVYNHYKIPKLLCPFHNDRRAGSFRLLKKANRYRCYSCGSYGDGIQFVQEKEGTPFRETVLKLALQFQIITLSQLEDFKLDELEEMKIKQPPKVYDDILFEEEADNIADSKTLHEVFTVFSNGNANNPKGEKLSKKHLEHLKKERKLSMKDIERVGYFTMPTRSKMFMNSFLGALKEQYGHEPDVLHTIPGFYQVEGSDAWDTTFIAHRGIGIPVRNEVGEIVGIQVRRNQVNEGESRYVWFSSSFANNPDRTDMKEGTGSGSPIHISYPQELKSPNDLFITEGIFKSERMAKEYKGVAVSVQGIQNWKGQIEPLVEHIEETRGQAIHRIHFMFDSDMSENVHVYLASKRMYEDLKESFPFVGFMHFWWNDQFGKGIDDVLNAGFGAEVKHLDSKTFTKAYDELIELIEESAGETIYKVEKEWIREEFFENIAPKFKKKR